MPVVSLGRDRLFARLGRTFTDEQFEELCFEYGIELDDVTSEAQQLRKETGKADAGASEEVLYKIDIPANRYDMLCMEGISRALNVFRGELEPPAFTTTAPSGHTMLRIVVEKETALVRPFVVGAVLRGVTLDRHAYDSFIDLQDKLHQNLCRQRSLVAIGTHDLDTIQAPFTYAAQPPGEITFVPLKQTEAWPAHELLAHYAANDQRLKRYVPLIQSSKVYPVIRDAAGTVLSLPPIINGAHSAISLDTRNVFIECTATDLTKAKVVLNTVVTMFSEYCERPFDVEPVEVVDALGHSTAYPDLAPRPMAVAASYINGLIGTRLPATEIATLLTRMQLRSTVQPDGETLEVMVPPTRSDVLHACDVAEDVAIAFGYNNIKTRLPRDATVGGELPLNQLTELLRCELASAGFTEILTWALCSRAENSGKMRRPEGEPAVEIGNPATQEFQVARTRLLPSALKTLAANKDAPLPVRLFEVSDVVLLDTRRAVGARNERRVTAALADRTSGFEAIHGLLMRLMQALGVRDTLTHGPATEDDQAPRYSWRPSEEPEYFPGRQAEVLFGGTRVGAFGIVHPDVLRAFDLAVPVTALELNLEPFCFDQFGKGLLDKYSNEV